MKTKLVPLLTLIALALMALATNARAGHRTFPQFPTRQSELPAGQTGALKDPVKSVLDHYLKIQSALANDSIDGVASNASAIGSAVRSDSMKMLSPEMAAQADALAKTKDLAEARAIFRRLSKSLIQYLADHKITSAYVEIYCPMAKASWIQKGKKINNPYMGGSMRSCGTIKQKPGASRSDGWLTDDELKHV